MNSNIKWLVRELTIEEEGETRFLPLTYIIGVCEGEYLYNVLLSPFDRERWGFIYVDKLHLRRSGDTWTVVSRS